MPKWSPSAIVFNVAGVAILVTVAGYMVTSFFNTEELVRCSERYPAGKQFAFENPHGDALTPIELQGRAGPREWGVLKNTRITRTPNSPWGVSMDVSLATTDDEEKVNQNGVGFVWQEPAASHAKSTCLSYGVMLPRGFAFSEPGYLPGIYGASDLGQLDVPNPVDGFAVRMGWAQAGDVGAEVRSPETQGFWQGANSRTTWPVGRWVMVEQEVVLNTPNLNDGALRVWIDGSLRVNNHMLTLRAAHPTGISGVVADVGYARTASDLAAIKVSPFVLQWQ